MLQKTHLSIRANREFVLAAALLLVGVWVRAAGLGSTPCGMNQDEAFAGYEALSLLHSGMDSAGYPFPCYFVSWGSGMNVLESYLAIPFLALFGCSVAVVRLPQLVCGCLSLLVFYLLLRRLFSEKTALLGLGLLVVSPWHIMLSRWALESNLAPAFLLFGLYFLVRGLEDNKYLLFSAAAYGISLYAYSIAWLAVPLTLLVWGIYLLYTRQKISLRWAAASGGVLLFVLAVPLLLFLLVNKGILPEIVTPFFSVPKLLVMRSGEISLKNLLDPASWYNLLRLIVGQNDGLIWNSTEEFGMFYKFSLPFIVLGFAKLVSEAVQNIRARRFCTHTLVVLGMFCAGFVCLLLSNLNINKANCLHFYTLILLTAGVQETFCFFRSHVSVRRAILCGYALFFAFFVSFYFTQYNEQASPAFRDGLQEAVVCAKQQPAQTICVDSSIPYSLILFFDQTPVEVFHETVEYTNYPAAFLSPRKFSCYTFGIDTNQLDPGTVYILPQNQAGHFSANGYTISNFGRYCVAVMQ